MKFIFAFLTILTLFSCSNKMSPVGKPVYNDSTYRQFWSVDWSPDDQFIAAAGVDSTVRVYFANTLKLFKSFTINNYIHSVEWNPDGGILAIATLSDYVQYLNIKTGKITKLDNSLGPNHLPDGNGARAIGWNQSGDILAVGGLDGIIKIWDKQGNLLKYIDKYKPETDFVSYLALDWHPSKNMFVAANFEIQLFDSAFNEVKVMDHVNKAAIILCADWHPSGDFFVIGDYGHNWEGENVPSLLHFWSSDGQLIKSVRGSKGEYRNIDWNKTGDLLSTASDKLRLWTRDGELLYESPSDGSNYLWGVSWNKKGTKIVTASRHRTIAIWDSTAKLLKRIDAVK
jgi:WD40 repeat protein